MFFLITIFLTALVSALFGLLPGKLQRRSVIKQDIVWAVGLWLATWLFAVFAYHRPGPTIGFNAFRLVAVTALNGWTGFVTAGLRSFGRKGLKAVVPLLLVTALGLEVFVGNVAYFNTHSYEPFQLVDYLDENINVGRGLGTISLDEGRTYLRFLNIDRPIYNLRFDGLVNDDTDLLHADSAVTFTIEGTDAANTQLTRFGSWQVGLQAPRTHTISLDLTGNVSMMTLTASGYSSTYAQFPVALTFSGITANAPRALNFSVLRFIAVFLVLLAVYGLRPASGLWHRRWLAGNVCDRAAATVLGLILAAFVVVVPFWEPGNTGLATKDYNTAFWDGKSTVSFVYQQYGALAHSLLNGRLDLEADPPAELLALDNPYDAGARDAAQINDIHWDHAFYNGRYYVYFGIVPCLLFQLPFEALTGIQNLAYAPCMVVLGLLLLAACFGVVGQAVCVFAKKITDFSLCNACTKKAHFFFYGSRRILKKHLVPTYINALCFCLFLNFFQSGNICIFRLNGWLLCPLLSCQIITTWPLPCIADIHSKLPQNLHIVINALSLRTDPMFHKICKNRLHGYCMMLPCLPQHFFKIQDLRFLIV